MTASARTLAPSGIIGLVAALAAFGAWGVGGSGLTALEWSVYDRWLRTRSPAAVSADLVLVVRDPASEARFGSGSWDRAVLARLVTSLSRAGAMAIGLDVPVGDPSPPGRGGATSDAMLSEATALAGAVVYPLSFERLPVPTQRLGAVGHTLTVADADGVVRRASLSVQAGDQRVPVFAAQLITAAPVKGPASILIDYVAAGAEPGLGALPFSEVWRTVEQRDGDALARLVGDRIVLVLAEVPAPPRPTPVGPMADMVIQAHLLNTLLTKGGTAETPAAFTIVGVLLAAVLAAWLLLSLGSWKGLTGIGALVAGYAVSLVLALPAGLALPVWAPFSAVAMAAAGALLW
ncbi:MAG: CHASE2 domain-containing protein, partial [Candidatus Rokuibacteriota bacterium]